MTPPGIDACARDAALWYLNDSMSEDSAQEHAVIYRGRQIESITFSWCTGEQARRHIRHCTDDAEALLDAEWAHPLQPRVEDWRSHHCRHCA